MIRIIFNPKSGKSTNSEKLERLLEKFQSEKMLYAMYKTERKGHGKSLARELSKTKEPILIAGGDGTVYETINGMNIEIPISIIPLGTGNDIAKTLGIKFNLKNHVEALKKPPKLIDYIVLNDKYRALSFVALGAIIEIAREKNNNKKGYFSILSSMIFSFKAKTYEIEFNGEKKVVEADLLSIHNATYAGGGMYLGHDSKIDDGFLDLLIVEYKGKLRRILNIIAILNKNLHKQPNVSIAKINKITIKGENDKYCCVDGEIIEEKEINAQIIHKGLKILY